MALTNFIDNHFFGGNFGTINTYPVHILMCLKTPWFDTPYPFFSMWGNADYDGDGQREFGLRYGTFATMTDRGGNYGEPHDKIEVYPSYSLDSNGKTNQWAWIWLHYDSLSLRGFRIDDSADFTDTRSFTTPQNIQGGGIFSDGGNLPPTAKLAHLHFLKSFTNTEFEALRAGTLNPATHANLYDGFVLKDSINSVKGLMTLGLGASTFDPDMPLVPTGSGGGGTTPDPGGGTVAPTTRRVMGAGCII